MNSTGSVVIVGMMLAFSFNIVGHAEQNARPGINDNYKNPSFKQWVNRFESSGREVYDKRKQIVSHLGLSKNSIVADVGAGTGLFTRLFSKVAGKVYAVDTSAEFVRNLKLIGKKEGWRNVTAILSTSHSVKLKKNSVDLVFVCDTYHHFEFPKSMLASIHKALKPGATLVIIDFRKQKGVSSEWVMNHVRADKNTVVNEVSSAGFKLKKEHMFLEQNYFLVFRKI